MTRYRELLRPVLLLQTGILTLSTLEATVVAAAGIGSPVPVLLTAAAATFVAAASRTGRLNQALVWTERLVLTTFVVDTAISLFTAGSLLEPTVWVARFIVPVFVLRQASADRRSHALPAETTHRMTVPA